MENQRSRDISLILELETSVKLIELGLGEYQNLGGANDFYYLPFQLISSGLERLMKCHICLGYLEQNDTYPNFNYIKRLGHDLLKLQEHIIDNFFSTQNRPALADDLNYIQIDPDLSKLIYILSEFGKYARYYNLDIVTNARQPSIDAKSEWQQFETDLVLRDNSLVEKLNDFETSQEVHDSITSIIVIHIEKFTRAICRQFTLGGLGKKAQQLSSIVSDFIIIKNDDLGNRNYRSETTKYTVNKKSPHKRTFIDDLERKTNSKYKSKKIRKSDYEGEWPFYADEVIIECREKQWCIVTINGFDYALNGAAQGRYKLENVHEAGMAILGKSIGPFIERALNL